MAELREELFKYASSGEYPFHMPGHKRNLNAVKGVPDSLCEIAKADITEIDGFDNLHDAHGLIRQIEIRAEKIWNSEESHILVNGSSCGILAAVSACMDSWNTDKNKIIMARNSHKSAYNALLLNHAEGIFVYPKTIEKRVICGAIDPEEIKDLLEKNKDIKAVLITSPTYEGVISKVKEIAEIVHTYHIPLIVDEAHGAHLGLFDHYKEKYGMKSAVTEGADIVIQSLHKTLPAYTQSAIIHINGKLVNREKLRRYLTVYQSSSPSYILMAGIDECLQILENNGKYLFENYYENLKYIYAKSLKWREISLLKPEETGKEAAGFDIGKLVISSKNTDRIGKKIYELLKKKYHLQLEMAAGDYCIAMTSIMDQKTGFQRLADALSEIDEMLFEENKTVSNEQEAEGYIGYPVICQKYRIAEAEGKEKREISIQDAIGKTAGAFVYAYPPGIPIAAPGEILTEQVIKTILWMKMHGIEVHGMDQDKVVICCD